MYRQSLMKTMKSSDVKEISVEAFLGKIAEGMSKKVICQKPILGLTKDGVDYNWVSDRLSETYVHYNINTDALNYDFVEVEGKLEMAYNGQIVNGHHSDVDIYEYLGGPLGYDEKIHRYCVNLAKYESKLVISLMCIADKNCSVEDIPAWMTEEFEIFMLK